ncbi:AsmA family protein [Microvirga massiliensis]|uniref:AsmA family protein n=1 Tax=Microvirga massiliensis TaxID=1033741 RepID=UPI00062BD9EC|nr:AsmA family protein [Microvirga massiliensis]
MSRRLVLILALAVLAAMAAAVAPWTLTTGGMAGSVARQLDEAYGLKVEVLGRSTIAILPIPRVKFENVRIAARDGSIKAEGGTLRGELRWLPLLAGRIEVDEIALADARIDIAGAVQAPNPISALRAFFIAERPGKPVRRLILTGSTLRWAPGWDGALENLQTVANWYTSDERIVLAGAAHWRGERIEVSELIVSPRRWAANKPWPFVVNAGNSFARASLAGTVEGGPDLLVNASGTFEAKSLRDFARWSAIDIPLASLMQAGSVQGRFTADHRRFSWPAAVVHLGKNRLDGSLAIRFDAERPVVSGTLAADQLDLSNFATPFTRARSAAGFWSYEEFGSLTPPVCDLDLRLSASDAQFGAVTLGDAALNLTARANQVEIWLGRAGLRGGTVKGRLALAASGNQVEVRSQANFENIDLAAALADLGHPHWITGQASGQFALEGSGRSPREIVRHSKGHARIAVRDGELVGIGFGDALKRLEKRPLAASLDWRGGRTPFDLAQGALTVTGGAGEIVASMNSAALNAEVAGNASLVDRFLAMKTQVQSSAPALSALPPLVFDVRGGWDDVAVIPDARSLIERSGAAKPLLRIDSLAPVAAPGAVTR